MAKAKNKMASTVRGLSSPFKKYICDIKNIEARKEYKLPRYFLDIKNTIIGEIEKSIG
jgi:hypothetical protein